MMILQLINLQLNDVVDIRLHTEEGVVIREDENLTLVRIVRSEEEISTYELLHYFGEKYPHRRMKIERYIFRKDTGSFLVIPKGLNDHKTYTIKHRNTGDLLMKSKLQKAFQPKEFLDKNGVVISPGSIITYRFFVRRRERPGCRRVTEGFMGEEVILPDEGKLLDPEPHWVKYRVEWHGACLVATRFDCSNLSLILTNAKFDENGKKISTGHGEFYLHHYFNSEVWEIERFD